MEPLVLQRTLTLAPSLSPATAGSPPLSSASARPTLAALFATEESGLLRFAAGIVRRRSVAEEVVQEAFLRLHPLWNEIEQPRAWLYRTVRNLALNHLRDRRPESELQEEIVPHDAALPAEQLGRNEAVGTMQLAMAELPAEDRELIRLKYVEGLRYDEISRRTGLSVGNVGYRLHHLLKSLAETMRRSGIEDSRG